MMMDENCKDGYYIVVVDVPIVLNIKKNVSSDKLTRIKKKVDADYGE